MLGHRQKCFTSCWAKIFHPHSSRRTLWNAICSTNEANACKVHGRKGRKAKHRISSLAPVSSHLGHPLNHSDNAKKEVKGRKKGEKAKFSTKGRKKKTRETVCDCHISGVRKPIVTETEQKLRLLPDSVFKSQNAKQEHKSCFPTFWLEKHEQLIARR